MVKKSEPKSGSASEYVGSSVRSLPANVQPLPPLPELYRTMRKIREVESALIKLFGGASRLEADFWQMGLDAQRA